jgi:hypothetical protein
MEARPFAMPLTPFQTDVFKVIAANRNPDSFVAGGIVLNRDRQSVRYSNDIDLFHDTSEALVASAAQDADALRAAGYEVAFSRQEPTFHQASVVRALDQVRLDWAADSAFRFFPIVADEILGYRLHDADAATNKVLAAIARRKVRDFIDLIQMDRVYMPLGIAVWAAVGKDEGYTPDLIIQELRRNSRINPASLDDLKLVHPGDAVAIKAELLACFASAEKLITTIPPEPLGCLYLEPSGQPARGDVFDPSWVSHFGSVKGAWPKIGE